MPKKILVEEELAIRPRQVLAIRRQQIATPRQEHALPVLVQEHQENPTFLMMEDLATGHTTLQWILTD